MIKADAEISYIEFPKSDAKNLSREQIITQMLDAGLWPLFVNDLMLLLQIQMTCQKRYSYQHLIGPLACDSDFVLHGMEKNLNWFRHRNKTYRR